MKIEMGESLFLSWLRHVKQCQIVQLNWKPSNSWELTNEQRIIELLQVFRDFIQSKYNRELFGKKTGQSHAQILRQSEIDALGFELNGNKISSAYAIDVAFHEGGLIYGNREETVCRVIKKLVRSSLILLGYFNINDGEVIFASPKVSPKIYSELEDVVQQASVVAKNNDLNFRFRFLGNQDFEEKVISPVVSLSNEVADTSELFMRSIQLYSLFGNKKRAINSNATSKVVEVSDEIKIGQLVRTTFNRLFSQKLFSDEVLNNLQDANYSKRTFGIPYPALKKINPDEPTAKQKLDHKGRARYWSDEFANGKYLLCSQWYERHRKKFLEWLSNIDRV